MHATRHNVSAAWPVVLHHPPVPPPGDSASQALRCFVHLPVLFRSCITCKRRLRTRIAKQETNEDQSYNVVHTTYPRQRGIGEEDSMGREPQLDICRQQPEAAGATKASARRMHAAVAASVKVVKHLITAGQTPEEDLDPRRVRCDVPARSAPLSYTSSRRARQAALQNVS